MQSRSRRRFDDHFCVIGLACAWLAGGCEVVSGLNDIHATGHETVDASIEPIDSGGDGGAESGTVDHRDATPLETGIVDRATTDGTPDITMDVTSIADASTEAAAADACRSNPVGSRGSPSAIGGGPFMIGAPAGSDANLATARPRHGATLTSFQLSTTEVTVAEFRAFVGDYDCWRASHPAPDEGAFLRVTGYGWKPAWSNQLPKTAAALVSGVKTCGAGAVMTWRDVPDAASDVLPINCIDWYEALAFCIWQGGRLPIEAEWEFAAANGNNQWVYPTSPVTMPFPGTANFGPGPTSPIDVTKKEGAEEPFGLHHLQGNVAEWIFDARGAYATASCSGTSCITLPVDSGPAPSDRGYRGGSWKDPPFESYRRAFASPDQRTDTVGLRCAFDPAPDR